MYKHEKFKFKLIVKPKSCNNFLNNEKRKKF